MGGPQAGVTPALPPLLPGPLEHAMICDCRVLHPFPDGRLHYIHYCPLHQAAEELLAALKGVGEQRGSVLCWCQHWSWYKEIHDQPCEAARNAITKATDTVGLAEGEVKRNQGARL